MLILSRKHGGSSELCLSPVANLDIRFRLTAAWLMLYFEKGPPAHHFRQRNGICDIKQHRCRNLDYSKRPKSPASDKFAARLLLAARNSFPDYAIGIFTVTEGKHSGKCILADAISPLVSENPAFWGFLALVRLPFLWRQLHFRIPRLPRPLADNGPGTVRY